MKHITDFRVLSNTGVKDRMFCLVLTPADGSPIADCRPGQFVELRIDNAPDVFLRRPISIHRIDRERNELHLLIQTAGRATNRLATLQKGDLLNLVYPLGNGFTIGEKPGRYLLIGGGVGIAPLLETGCELKRRGHEVTFLLGIRSLTPGMDFWLEPFRQTAPVLLTTEDGSAGEKGFVTMHSGFDVSRFDAIRVCGPGPMMKAVMQKVRQDLNDNVPDHFCEVSLENKMACGLGVCLCCVEDTKEGHKCVCSDGPVFCINQLK